MFLLKVFKEVSIYVVMVNGAALKAAKIIYDLTAGVVTGPVGVLRDDASCLWVTGAGRMTCGVWGIGLVAAERHRDCW